MYSIVLKFNSFKLFEKRENAWWHLKNNSLDIKILVSILIVTEEIPIKYSILKSMFIQFISYKLIHMSA